MSDVQPSDAAVTAAAEAMEDAAMQWLGRDLGTIHRDDIARAALAAGLAVEYAALADKIEAARPHIPPSFDPKRREALIVRSTLNRVLGWVRAATGGTP